MEQEKIKKMLKKLREKKEQKLGRTIIITVFTCIIIWSIIASCVYLVSKS